MVALTEPSQNKQENIIYEPMCRLGIIAIFRVRTAVQNQSLRSPLTADKSGQLAAASLNFTVIVLIASRLITIINVFCSEWPENGRKGG